MLLSRGKTPLADNTGNGRDLRNFDIHIGDVLMLMETMCLAANTEMMCHRPGAEKRLREYQARLDAMIPDAARLFDGGDWCEINMALADATSYEVGIESRSLPSYTWSNYKPTGTIVITIGKRSWTSKSWDIKEDSDEFRTVLSLLEELSPIDCERAKTASIVPESS